MTFPVRLAALVVAGGLVLGVNAFAAERHSHGNASAPVAGLELDNGAKWKPDAPLRTGMEGIKRAVEAALPKIHRDTYTPGDYKSLSKKVHGHVDYMVANCKLPPEVDAQAHKVLEQVIEGAAKMDSGPDRHGGVVTIVNALEGYGRHFDHPHWSGGKH